MKKKLAFLLAIVMVLSLMFVGCGSEKDSDTKTTTKPLTTEEAVVGKWTATVDFTDVMVSGMGDMGDMAEYFEFKDFELKLVYELKADKTYTVALDEDVTVESADKLADQMMDGMEAYITDMLEASGVDMTFEEYLESQGMTADEYKATLRDEMDVSALDISGEGTYTVDGDTIVLSEEGYDETTTFTYDDGKLEFVSIESGVSDEEVEMINEVLEGATFKK